MAKIIPITEHFQHFLAEMKESFWGDLYGQTRQAWQQFFELQSERQRDRFSGWGRYERRRGKRRDYRNGYYERDFVTRFGTIRLRIARTRGKSFLPVGLRRFQWSGKVSRLMGAKLTHWSRTQRSILCLPENLSTSLLSSQSCTENSFD
jgi:hypothetical protein